ncbi:hypothetical protein BUALT_Bualt09G0027000 [Buddleja alternifolia]|uniref:DUF659 domain-containing protein n=1 Tax=Buddleja alternifolia TaxID=168488 RepID=A0AAV6X6M1_9LAMI|nr:hypothetical protein BUALT_Bualt09G0027000 [Buddleja alternifolia]
MSKLEEEATQRRDAKNKTPSLHCSMMSSSQSSYTMPNMSNDSNPYSLRREGYEPKKRKVAGDGPLEKAFNLREREILDGEIARMFYSGGLPFNLARNPYFVRAFTFAANTDIKGYVPPGYNALRTKLLDKEKENTESRLEATRSTWRTRGVTLVCDGWTDPQSRPLINFIAINENGSMFVRAVNCQGEYKDKWFISHLIKEVIIQVGVANVVQVVTDNAPVCRAAGLLVEQAYPHIFWTPCVVHTLNLALKNICAAKNTEANEVTYEECHWITQVAGSAVMIRNFIMNHSMRLSMFNEFSKLKLLAVAETRFASSIVMLKRFRLVKSQMQSMVISERWSDYRDDDVAKARLVKEKLLDDMWWDQIDYILSFTEPIYDMLRLCDTDQPSLHLESSFWSVVKKILEDRWSKSNTPLHCLAYSLNPRCSTKEWQDEHPHLSPPQSDVEISNMRKLCIKRYFPNEDARRDVTTEFAKFIACLAEFGDADSLRDRLLIDPVLWWVSYGSTTPNIQSIAIKLFGQVSSSSCAERNWSTYSFIHSTKRNQITPQRAEDLVFVHSNLRLLSRKTPEYKQGVTKLWDVGGGGDIFDSLDDIGILGFADLTIDEPELESDICVDDAREENCNDDDVPFDLDK